MEEVVDKLIKIKKTISTMESCTGGCVSNAITDVPGSSSVFYFGAVTYSNDYKIKIGVDDSLIKKYTVYSTEVAKEMSKVISIYADSNYGIGVTGKLNRIDINNDYGSNNLVHISIYDRDNDKYYTDEVIVLYDDRCKNKKMVLDKVIEMIKEIL